MNRSSKAKRKNKSKSCGLRTSLPDKGLRQQRLPRGRKSTLDKYLVKDTENTRYLPIEEEAMVMDLRDHQLYGLDSRANLIWKQADGQTKVKQIIERICDEFEVDWHTAEKDCLKFLNHLISHRLVSLSQNPI